MSNSKLYIAILDSVPSHMVPVLVAHSMLGAHLEFKDLKDEAQRLTYLGWLVTSFRKVTVKVNAKEFAKIASMSGVYLGHENSTLEGTKSCAIICPRDEYPNVIKFSKLWTP